MRRASTSAEKLRLLNALVASAIAVFFLAHSVLGTASLFAEGLTNSLPWLVWIMLGAAGAHVLASVSATALMLTDTERPPSSRKKRHFVLKWVTGAVLTATIAVHLLCILCPVAFPSFPIKRMRLFCSFLPRSPGMSASRRSPSPTTWESGRGRATSCAPPTCLPFSPWSCSCWLPPKFGKHAPSGKPAPCFRENDLGNRGFLCS